MAEYPHPSSPGRSANMRANRRTDTKPELALRRALHRRGYRFRKDYRLDLDGGRRVRPDIAFTARRVAVFVDGCFWHACPEHGSKPRANDWYWTPKLARNVERDRVADETLASAGWQVVRIWEHESLEQAVAAVIAVVGARMPAAPVASPVDPAASVVDPAASVVDPAASVVDPAAVPVNPVAPAVNPAGPAAVNPVAPAVNPVAPPVDPISPDDDPVAADGLRASRSADKI
jgi:DNA mismatch endonuclease (patch repair protein)